FGSHPDVVLQKPVSPEVLQHAAAKLLGVSVPAPAAQAPSPILAVEDEEIALDELLDLVVEETRPKALGTSFRRAQAGLKPQEAPPSLPSTKTATAAPSAAVTPAPKEAAPLPPPPEAPQKRAAEENGDDARKKSELASLRENLMKKRPTTEP